MSRKRPLGDDDGARSVQPLDRSLPKRARTYTERDSRLAKIFDGLSNEIEDVRMTAVKDLLAATAPEGNPGRSFIDRVTKRLVRGLCSSRKAARIGFVVALTAMLSQILGSHSHYEPELEMTVDGVVEMIIPLTKSERDVAGQEKRDHMYGRLFGYKAIIQAGILFQPTVPTQPWTKLLQQLFKIACNTPWLRKECGSILCESVQILSKAPREQEWLQILIDEMVTSGLVKTAEGVAVWLTIRREFPQFVLPKGYWHKSDPLCSKERLSLANVMKGSPMNAKQLEDTSEVPKGGSAQALLHPAWQVLIDSVIREAEQKREPLIEFTKFWVDVVDNTLFSESASFERKSWGLQLFCRTVRNCPEGMLKALFSVNLVRCLINQCSDKGRYLHSAARSCLREIKLRTEKSPSSAAISIEGLLSSTIRFDQITKTKTVQELVAMANDEALENVVPYFHRLLVDPQTEDHRVAETDRRILADFALTAVRSRSHHHSAAFTSLATFNSSELNATSGLEGRNWFEAVLRTFIELGYFSCRTNTPNSRIPRPSISESSRQMLQARLTSCLTHLLVAKVDQEATCPVFVVSVMRAWQMSSDYLEFAIETDKKVARTIKRAHKRLAEINSKDPSKSNNTYYRAFKLIYSLSLLQVYNADPDAVSVLEELDTCYESMVIQQDTTSGAFELLNELILSFASKRSLLSRTLAEHAFAVFASETTPENLVPMLEVLSKNESITGQQELFEDEDSAAMGSASNDSDEVDSDVQILSGPGHSKVVTESASGASSPSDPEDEESVAGSNSDDNDELVKFDALLAETLKTTAADGDHNSSGSSDEDMDDDQMMALDPQLIKIFQERKNVVSKKKERQDAKETVINFKNRVLDLLLILVKQEHGNPLCLYLIMPLLCLIRTTTAKQVAEKASNLLKQYFDKSKAKGLPVAQSADVIQQHLSDVHDEAIRGGSKLFANGCSRSSLFLTKVLVAGNQDGFKKAVRTYSATHERWLLENPSGLNQAFFMDWFGWCRAFNGSK